MLLNRENVIFWHSKPQKRIFPGIVDKPNDVPPRISGICNGTWTRSSGPGVACVHACSLFQDTAWHSYFSRMCGGMDDEG